MLKTQKVCWWRRGPANTEGKLGKEPDGEMGSLYSCTQLLTNRGNFNRWTDIFILPRIA
jgi:hypothetical protein